MRYDGREILTLDEERFPTVLKRRLRTSVRHYDTNRFNSPTEEEKGLLSGDIHIWGTGDKFYKLSLKYYGTIEDWYIIAMFNNKPTEFHVKEGDEIQIPFPLYLAKELFGVS